MSQPTLLGLFSPAPQSVTVSPLVRAARRSGIRAISIGHEMIRYREALIAHGPATDSQIAAVLRVGVSSCCGRRGDWNHVVPEERPLVVAVDRVKVGKATQCRWRWAGER